VPTHLLQKLFRESSLFALHFSNKITQAMRPTWFAVGRREEALQANTIRAAVSELVATALYVFASEGSTLALGTDSI
jgi:hypothetical protein